MIAVNRAEETTINPPEEEWDEEDRGEAKFEMVLVVLPKCLSSPSSQSLPS